MRESIENVNINTIGYFDTSTEKILNRWKKVKHIPKASGKIDVKSVLLHSDLGSMSQIKVIHTLVMPTYVKDATTLINIS